MRDVELLRFQADAAFKDLLESIEGLTEQQAWRQVQLQPGEYMHTEGSILSLVMHVAGGKFLYGSAAYRNLEVRWRDIVGRMESFWPSWEAAKDYLDEAHRYWLASWSEEHDLERPVQTFRAAEWPSWRVISTITLHDAYHAGQIHYLRTTVAPSSDPPPEEGDLWRKYCGDLPSW